MNVGFDVHDCVEGETRALPQYRSGVDKGVGHVASRIGFQAYFQKSPVVAQVASDDARVPRKVTKMGAVQTEPPLEGVARTDKPSTTQACGDDGCMSRPTSVQPF
ncbi:hypothetical protein HRbin30_03324 [bacterium HR30]|nr:hypothetical protein HRbin30_03324 [bacterium HR30]